MRLMLSALFFSFFTHFACAAEIFYPKEPLRNDPIESTQSLYPGTFDAPLTSGNRVTVNYVPGGEVPDPDSVFAGFARVGSCENNRLVFRNGDVPRFILGGFSLKGDVKKNSVVFIKGTAADAAIGKICGGQTKDGDVQGNSTIIYNGKVIGDVYGGDADMDGHAADNRIVIYNGELSGFVNGGGVSRVGIARNNNVAIFGGKIGMGVSGGFAHFAPGAPSDFVKEFNGKKTNSVVENCVLVFGETEINGNVSGGFVLDSDGSVEKNTVDISGGTIRGNVYGGRAFSGDSNGNTVMISGGTISDRDEVVYGGYVHKPDTGRATGNSMILSGSPDLKTITLYGNNLPTWKTDANTLKFEWFKGTIRGLSHFQEVHVDKNSDVTVLGEGPHEIVNLNNEGRMVFKNGKLTVHGKTTGNRVE